METKYYCTNCNAENKINKDTIKQIEVKDNLGDYFIMTYFVCEQCKSNIVVQIDNIHTKELLKKIKLYVIKNSGLGVGKANKYLKMSNRLEQKRQELKDLCSGKTFFNLDGNLFIKSLTFNKGGDIIESNM